jgi:biotin transport system substrate-specific component
MRTRTLILTALFAALTAVGAFLRIPVGPVPVTLQFLFTAMAGILLGRKYGALSQLVYVLLGLAGLPVFTAGGGPGYVFQPSFGFLLGLIPCAWVIGALCRRRSDPLRLVLACLAGLAVLYLIGVPYMALILNVYLDKGLGAAALLKLGMLPFLPGDGAKIAVAAAVCPALRRRLCNFDEFRG